MTAQSTDEAERPAECLATRWRHCRWEGRYDTVEPPQYHMPVFMSGNVASLMARSTYVRDVCARCGAVKERQP